MSSRSIEEPPRLKPLAWYGGSWAYSDPDPAEEPEPTPLTWDERKAQFDPTVFGMPEGPGEGRGIVVGRFLPPHRGHELVFHFAQAFVRDLTLLVRVSPEDEIPAETRLGWLRELFGSAWVQPITDPEGLDGADITGLTAHWTKAIQADLLPPAFVFGSDGSAAELARQLGARYVAVDPERQAVPVSSSEIRKDPRAAWRFLAPCVRAHYALRVHVVGAEQTGKTTLVRHLAQHYHTANTTEYARTLYPAGTGWQAADTQMIARAQLAQEAAMARQCNRVLFCDTDLLSVELWSERLFGGSPTWMGQAERSADLYLLLDTYGPAAGPDFPEDRQRFQERLAEELAARDLPHLRLSGSWREREAAAAGAVDALLHSKSEAGGA